MVLLWDNKKDILAVTSIPSIVCNEEQKRNEKVGSRVVVTTVLDVKDLMKIQSKIK